jgi:hypothetical protein
LKVKATFQIEYNYFEKGEVITPTSPRSPLTVGTLYTVQETRRPMFYGEEPVVFVVGRDTGVSGEYLREATPEEILQNTV